MVGAVAANGGAPVAWLARLAARPGDGAEERLRKAALLLSVAVVFVLAFIWVGTYLALGLVGPALIPLSYQAASAASVGIYLRTKRYAYFRDSQLALMLVLPFLLQWSLGGFVSASAVSLWAFVSPLGALVFHGARQALPWFAAFVALLVASPFVEAALPAEDRLGASATTVFSVLNLVGPLGVSFLVIQYFVRERDREHARSDGLLLNILPAAVAERLKAGGGVIADRYDDVTVVFTDLVGFTAAAAAMDAEEVVAVLDEVVMTFDRLAERLALEKVKTIGDGYMAAAGAPTPRADHAHAAADFALAAVAAVDGLAASRCHRLSLRVGIASGPVIAGVIGQAKFGYDLWGDTVNTASRMESHAPPGSIQITAETAALLGGAYRLQPRESVDVRGKGKMRPYLLLGTHERPSSDAEMPTAGGRGDVDATPCLNQDTLT